MEPSQSVVSVQWEQQLQETILSNAIDSQITGLSLEENEINDTGTPLSAAEAINLLNQAKMLNGKTSSQIKSIVSVTIVLIWQNFLYYFVSIFV